MRLIYIVFVISLLSASINSNAQTTMCDAILQFGIFDKSDKLDQESKYELTKNAHCRSSARSEQKSGGIGYGQMFSASGQDAKQESENFCGSTFSEVSQNQLYWNAVSKASVTIADAWQGCIQANSGGVSHYIEPSSDSARFTYKIVYTPDGDPAQVTIEEVIISGHKKCDGQPLLKGTLVGSGGHLVTCYRDPKNAVVVTVKTVGGTGTRNLRKIELPAYRKVTFSPQPVVKKTTKPRGLIDVHAIYPLKNTNCQSLGADWQDLAGDETSGFRFCKKIGESDQYIHAILEVDGISSNTSACSSSRGSDWSYIAFDVPRQKWLCKGHTTFDQLVKSDGQYFESVEASWPSDCPQPQLEFYRTSGDIRLCGTKIRIRDK
jgi:hypothetical protein